MVFNQSALDQSDLEAIPIHTVGINRVHADEGNPVRAKGQVQHKRGRQDQHAHLAVGEQQSAQGVPILIELGEQAQIRVIHCAWQLQQRKHGDP